MKRTYTYFSTHLKLIPGSSLGDLMVSDFLLPGHQMDAFLVHAFPRPILNSPVFIQTQISAAVLVPEARDLLVEERDLIDCKEIQPGWSVYPADTALVAKSILVFQRPSSTRRKLKTTAEVTTLFHQLSSHHAENGLCHFPEKKILFLTVNQGKEIKL